MTDLSELRSTNWLVSPAFDVLFLINCLWPAVFLLGFYSNLAGHSSLQFWQVYFVTTPHRWITLVLVFGDPARFRERPVAFPSIAIIVVSGCLLIQQSTGALTCLLAVDYIWNAWHFAAQHHGVYRLYARQANPRVSAGTVHKWLVRFSLLYVIFRVAGWSWQIKSLEQALLPADYVVGALLLGLVLNEWLILPTKSWGRSGYLTSVMLLYSALLWAVHLRRPDMVLVLATTSALFHAGEYLAITWWNTRGREKRKQSAGMIQKVAARWLVFLACFAMALGTAGWMFNHYWINAWLTVNVMVAFLHYTYDGLIWKKRPAPR